MLGINLFDNRLARIHHKVASKLAPQPPPPASDVNSAEFTTNRREKASEQSHHGVETSNYLSYHEQYTGDNLHLLGYDLYPDATSGQEFGVDEALGLVDWTYTGDFHTAAVDGGWIPGQEGSISHSFGDTLFDNSFSSVDFNLNGNSNGGQLSQNKQRQNYTIPHSFPNIHEENQDITINEKIPLAHIPEIPQETTITTPSVPLTPSSSTSTTTSTPKASSSTSTSTSTSEPKPSSSSRVRKRELNTLAARRYRQKRVTQLSALEAELLAVKRERDELRVRVARLEGESEVLRTMVGRGGGRV